MVPVDEGMLRPDPPLHKDTVLIQNCSQGLSPLVLWKSSEWHHTQVTHKELDSMAFVGPFQLRMELSVLQSEAGRWKPGWGKRVKNGGKSLCFLSHGTTADQKSQTWAPSASPEGLPQLLHRWYSLKPLLSTHNPFSAIARFLYLTDNNQKPYTFFSQITNHLLMQLCDCWWWDKMGSRSV